MAKKRKRIHGTRRRRRISGKGGIQEIIMKAFGLAGGGLATAFGVQAAATAFGASLPAWVAPAGFVGMGLTIPHLVKDNPLAEGVGMGMAAVGAVMALNQTAFSVPGISGMAMSSNAGPQNYIARNAVGYGPLMYKKGYATNTVGSLGSLISN